MVSGSAIGTLVVFILSIVCVIHPFSIPISGRKFPINLTTAPIIAILILWAAQCLVAQNVSLESNESYIMANLWVTDSGWHCVSYTQFVSIVNASIYPQRHRRCQALQHSHPLLLARVHGNHIGYHWSTTSRSVLG
jgi:hypothetical protein